MDVKELIASLAEFDEMEAPDGMNIAEGVEEENEKAENKRKKRVYQKAVEALSELQDLIGEGINPAQTEADETTQFYNRIQDLIEEIDSMSLAFDESLDEAVIEDGTLGDIEVLLDKISHIGIVCRGHAYNLEGVKNDKEVDFSFVSKSNIASPFKAPADNEYDPVQIAKECAEILRKNIEPAENEILALLDKYGYKRN